MIATDNDISVLGCGWYGLALATRLVEKGYSVKGSTTTPAKIKSLHESGILPFLVNFDESAESYDPKFFDCSVLIISIPPKRNTAEQHTFYSKIQRIAAAATTYRVPHIIFISSTSVYGDHDGEVTETTPTSPDTPSGKAIVSAEELLIKSESFTTAVVRFGGLIGPHRDPARFFAGKRDIPNGRAPVNLIHLSDCIGITLKIIELKAYGVIYNACSPEHPSRAIFYIQAAVRSGLEKPVFIDELQGYKTVNSINIPAKLHYNFIFSINSFI